MQDLLTFKQFMETFPARSLHKGEILLLSGDKPKAVYVIEQGLVRTYTITKDGSEHLISIHGDREALPVGYAYGLVNTAQYFYAAYSDCRVRLVSPEKYVQYLKTNHDEFYQQHIHAVLALMGALSRIDGLGQSRAVDKIAFTLLYLAEQVGANCAVGVTFDLGEISGKNKQMFMLNAVATPVLIEPLPATSESA